MKQQQLTKKSDEKKSTGSPQKGEPLYIAVGQIKKPHGLKGEVLFEVMTDFPERLKKGKIVYIGEQHKTETIAGTRIHNKGMILHFKGKDTIEDIEAIRNEIVYVKSEELPILPAGEYYFHQIIGLQVFNEQGDLLGELSEILETGANDVYLIKDQDGNEMLVPAIDSVMKEIDLDNRKMIISPPEWY